MSPGQSSPRLLRRYTNASHFSFREPLILCYLGTYTSAWNMILLPTFRAGMALLCILIAITKYNKYLSHVVADMSLITVTQGFRSHTRLCKHLLDRLRSSKDHTSEFYHGEYTLTKDLENFFHVGVRFHSPSPSFEAEPGDFSPSSS